MDFKQELLSIEKENKEKELTKARLDQQLKTLDSEIAINNSELKELVETEDIAKADAWIEKTKTELTEIVTNAREQLK